MKKKRIDIVEWIRFKLEEGGIPRGNYVISLMGPTVFMCKGVRLTDADVRVALISSGVKIEEC